MKKIQSRNLYFTNIHLQAFHDMPFHKVPWSDKTHKWQQRQNLDFL